MSSAGSSSPSTSHPSPDAGAALNDLQFQTLFKHFPVPTYTWRWKETDLELIGFNDAADAFTKNGVRALIGKKSIELYAADSSVYIDMHACFRERKTVQRELHYSMRSVDAIKDLVTTYVFVPPDLVMIHTEDITERKKAEAALRESEERYRTLFEASPLGLGVADEHGTLLAFNEAMMRPGNYTREDIHKIGNVAALYASTDDRDRALGLARKQGYLRQHEVKFKRKDGSHYIARLSLQPIALNGKRGWQAMAEDITELKQLEAQVLQAQKIDSVGRLAGGIAHDFNNMLTAVLGYADILQRRLGTEPVEELIGIRDTALRASGLVRQLLGFARKQSVQPKLLNINERAESLSQMLKCILGERVNFSTDFAHDLANVKIDPVQFEQVLVNLTVNARDAMPAGGTLLLRTRMVQLGEMDARRRGDISPGEYVELSASDTGTGMSDEVLYHLFEPFFTTKEQGKGTGLGLATCYGIAKQNGGHIWAESELGKGSTFFLILPAKRGASASSAENIWIDTNRPSGRGTVLLAEDDPAVRFIIGETLRAAGYSVLEAGDGSDALRLLDETQREIDALVTDVVMPVLGGKLLAERLWQSQPQLPVLFVSGYSKDELSDAVLKRPRVRFQNKPFTPDALLQQVNALLGVK